MALMFASLRVEVATEVDAAVGVVVAGDLVDAAVDVVVVGDIFDADVVVTVVVAVDVVTVYVIAGNLVVIPFYSCCWCSRPC